MRVWLLRTHINQDLCTHKTKLRTYDIKRYCYCPRYLYIIALPNVVVDTIIIVLILSIPIKKKKQL